MRKILFLILCLISMSCMSKSVFALTTLNETSEKQIINSGTNLTKYKRFTDKGWLSINIIDVDLKDKNTSLGVLTSSNGLKTFQNVKTMLTDNKNCIAAINADFFNGTSKKGNIIGMTVRDGEVLTSTYYENEVKDVLASFAIDHDNNVIFDYFTNKITLKNLNNDSTISIAEINKWSSNYEYPVLYTSDWGKYSLGSSDELVLTELVVKANKVVEVRYNKPAVEIPENGFVVSALGNSGTLLQNSFKPGNKISIDYDIELDIEKIKVAVSGGTILVKDGKVATYTHNISGSNPRTAVGVSKDGKTFYLITVDGRQVSSIGLSQTEFAEILLEKGIYTAMNLDGGGSTTMVVRELGDEMATVENSPSDGSLRNVPNAIAVFNTNSTGSLDKLVVEVENVNVFVGCKRKLNVKGYDKHYNPVKIDESKIKWSYSGVPVIIKDNVLVGGDVAGNSVVTASIGNAKGMVSIDVLSKPNELTISPKKIAVSKNECVTFRVSGQNKNGYFADLNNNEVSWKIEKGNASLKDGVFTANEPGDYIISVSAGNAISYALITIDANVSKLVNDFEKSNFIFKAYPEEVIGEVKLSNDEFYNGQYSAMLDYDFNGTNKTRAAYLRFNEGINLDKNADSLEIMAYSTVSTTDKIKAKITDKDGNVQYMLLCDGLESVGWKQLNLDLSNISKPATITDIYVAQDNANNFTSGSVYFDDLKINYISAESSNTLLPKDVKGIDELNTSAELDGSNSFRIVVSPEMREGILLEHLKNSKLESIINKDSEIVINTSQQDDKLLANVVKKKIVANGYGCINYKIATIISLDISNGGLRNTDSNQWISLKHDISNANKNVLIVMNGNLDDFKDEMEKQLFIDVLCELKRNTGKNIWVIQKGDNTDYSMKRGIKYLSISSSGYADPTLEDIENTNYILITVNDNKMTYEIKNVFK